MPKYWYIWCNNTVKIDRKPQKYEYKRCGLENK